MERGKLSGKDDKYYKFTILSSGEVSIISKAQMYYIHYYIYDANGNQVWEKDFYKFELNSSKKLTFQMTSSQIKKIYYYVYDKNGKQVWYGDNYADNASGINTAKKELNLAAGTYYLAFERWTDALIGI